MNYRLLSKLLGKPGKMEIQGDQVYQFHLEGRARARRQAGFEQDAGASGLRDAHSPGLDDDMTARAVAQSIVALGNALGKRIVAEGVETAGQAKWLTAIGCDELASDALLGNVPSHAAHLGCGFEETERVVYFRKRL